MFGIRKAIGLIAALVFGGGAMAEDRQAIIISNRNYEALRDVPEASRAVGIASTLRESGFDVSVFRDLTGRELRDVAPDLRAIINRGDRVFVFVSGQIVHGPRDSFLIGTDASGPGNMAIGQDGLSLGDLMDLLAQDAGAAALLVGQGRSGILASRYGQTGFGTPDIPQGVTVFSGPTDALIALSENALLVDGRSIFEVADGAPVGVTPMGYLPKVTGFVPAKPDDAISDADEAAEIELILFERARDRGTEVALTSFLAQYPDGANAQEARRLLAALQKSPEEQAREAETALRLSRSSRRSIQGDLSFMGFDTNGVDGIFGNGTRRALRRWQAANDYEVTGYLDQGQIRAIEDGARVERQKLEAQDAAFWRQTGRNETEQGYLEYLGRYPQGLFAGLAREELAIIDDARRASEAAAESSAFDDASAIDTERAYRDFLSDYPDGANADKATARIAEILASEGAIDIEAAKAEERKVLNNPITRLLAERRLGQLGYKPGALDGQFDDKTRRAIRAFQESVGLPVTGYIDNPTVARLLSSN